MQKKEKEKGGKKKHVSIKEPSPSFGLNANYVYRVFNKSISIKSHYLRASLTFLLRFRTRKSREQSEFSLLFSMEWILFSLFSSFLYKIKKKRPSWPSYFKCTYIDTNLEVHHFVATISLFLLSFLFFSFLFFFFFCSSSSSSGGRTRSLICIESQSPSKENEMNSRGNKKGNVSIVNTIVEQY